MRILKYRLDVTKEIQKVELPVGFNIIAVQNQHNCITFWAEVNPENYLKPRRFRVIGTGWDVDDLNGFHHLATVQIQDRGAVWHVYME